MNSKEKKKSKKKSKAKRSATGQPRVADKTLEKAMKKLQKEIRVREQKLEQLQHRLNNLSEGKKVHMEARVPRESENMGVAIAHRKAWKRHGYLRDRYEFHLAAGQDKDNARLLADKELRIEYGDAAGYTEEELQNILS